MAAVLLGALAFGLVGATGFFVATALGIRSLPEIVVASWVVGFAEVVLLVLALSPFHAARRPWLLTALFLCFAATGSWWASRGRPHPSLGHLRDAAAVLRSPVLGALFAVVAGALLYTLALILATAPNDWDSLAYHLARAAFWKQAGGVGYVEDAYFGRLNADPPASEAALQFLLEMTRSERATGLVQFSAVIAAAAGVFAIARRLGFARDASALAGLLFLTLPIVLLQASTTKNDLVVAALLVAATCFMLGTSRASIVLAGVATAFAIATKLTTIIALPVLLSVAVVAFPRPSRALRALSVSLGIVVGSFWYWVNLAETGSPFGGLAGESGDPTGFHPRASVSAVLGLGRDSLDLSGAIRLDALVYAAVAAAVATVLTLRAIATHGHLDRHRFRMALTTGALVLVPLVLVPVASAVAYGIDSAARHTIDLPLTEGFDSDWRPNVAASAVTSWYGPLGIVLGVGAGALAIAAVRRGRLPRVALVFAVSPFVFAVALAILIPYDTWQGRFFMYPVALSATLWGVLSRWRPLALAAATIGATTVVLSLVHYHEKPSGVRLFDGRVDRRSVWGMTRAEVQSLRRPSWQPVLERLETIPDDARVALALSFEDFGYPAFGSSLKRRVVLVPEGSAARGVDAGWLLASLRRAAQIDRRCWDVDLVAPGAATVFRRSRADCGA